MITRLRKMGYTLTARADAAAAIAQGGTRPPGFERDIELAMAWDGSKQKIRGPLKVPDWFRQSHAFRAWQRVHSSETFLTTDDAGNVYEIWCRATMEHNGKPTTWSPSCGCSARTGRSPPRRRSTTWPAAVVVVLRQDGYEADVLREHQRRASLRGQPPPPLLRVHFFDAQENYRAWHVSLDNPRLVQIESLNNPIGEQLRVSHAARKPRTTKPATQKSEPQRTRSTQRSGTAN